MCTENSKVTVAIPTVGRIDTLPTVITALAFQTRPISEIIILDEAKAPIAGTPLIGHALDVLSLQGTEVKIIRNRTRKGIGAARYRLGKEARNNLILMVDDDIVLRPNCLEVLLEALTSGIPWAVPVCFLVSAELEPEGYYDGPCDPDDPSIKLWAGKHEWFIPYYRYSKEFIRTVPYSGTQAILLRRNIFLKTCEGLESLGNLPREDTYMTKKMGPGVFTSRGECLHFSYPDQLDRGNWHSSMFYRMHHAVARNPDMFVDFMSANGSSASTQRKKRSDEDQKRNLMMSEDAPVEWDVWKR